MLKNVDFNESFFDMGGHSLAATYLLELVQNELGVDVRVHELFQYPTITQMSTVCSALSRALFLLKKLLVPNNEIFRSFLVFSFQYNIMHHLLNSNSYDKS